MSCQTVHPESGQECDQEAPHPLHIGGRGRERVWWHNESYIDPKDHARILRDMVRRVSP